MRGWGCGIGLSHPRRRPALTRSRLLLGVLVCYHRGTRTDEFRAQLSPSLMYKYTRRTRPHTRTRIRVVHARARASCKWAHALALARRTEFMAKLFPFKAENIYRVAACACRRAREYTRARSQFSHAIVLDAQPEECGATDNDATAAAAQFECAAPYTIWPISLLHKFASERASESSGREGDSASALCVSKLLFGG